MEAGRGRSLFLRIFLILVGVVALAQAASFLLLLAVPPPTPPLTPLDQVAAALRTGAGQGLNVETTPEPPDDNFADDREEAAARELAERLGAPVASVRVVQQRPSIVPGLFDGPPGRGRGGGPPGPRAAGPGRERPEILVGDFIAAVRTPAGWRTASLDGAAVSPWRLRRLLELLGIVLALVPVAWLLARRLTRPVAAFAAAAERLGKDPQGSPIVVEGPAEVAHAARAFNDMQERLRRYVENRTLMVGAMAHDIGTPLSRLAFRIEGAPEPLRTRAAGDIAEMKAMIGAALSFVRDLAQPSSRQPTSLRSLLHTVADELEDAGADVAVEAADEVSLAVDAAGVKRMLHNLLQNAVRYGGSARATLTRAGDEVRIDVVDRGPGIPDAHLDRVFEPFHRVEQSRNRATGGTGLGLSSALAIARAHGGDIALANLPEGGLLARVTLPC